MTTTARFCLTLALLLFAAWCAPADAQPADVRCLADGGITLCTTPTPASDTANASMDANGWTYNVCDLAGVFLSREAAWAKARAGKPLFDADIAPVSTAFEQIFNNACVVTATDSGWGYTIPQNILCWSGASLTQNQAPIRDFRRLDFTGLKPGTSGCTVPFSGIVYAQRGRKLACPKTYGTRTKPNGDLECWKLPPECSARGKVGNPITLLDGCKAQRELDYRSRTPGGVEVERFYNSGGYFRFDVTTENATDVWRTTWDRRVIVPPTPGTVLAYTQRADGSVQAFAPSGREMHNNQGGASALLERLTDATGAPTGWRLTTADLDVETYDIAGRLVAVVLRNGLRYALGYAKGRLATVTDTFGGLVTFTYDTSDRLGGFIAPGNREYVYGYDAMGRLTSVTYPDSAVRTYHYENTYFPHALTGITDENGVRYATWAYDGEGRAALSQHAGGVDSVTLYYGSYSSTANDGQVTVVDGYGTTRTYYYRAAGGVARIRALTDPVGTSVSTFDANGNVATFRDPNGTQTNYTYDLARNLEISRTEAFGTAAARTITTQWHPVYRVPAKISAPSGTPGVTEVTDYVYDARGNLIQRTVTAGSKSRQWAMTYTALGQLLTVDGPRIDQADITTNTYYDVNDPCVGCRGNLKTTTNALGHVTAFVAYDVDGQPTRTTDPSGVATAMTYDVRGRLETRTVNAGAALAETTAFDYDSAGQLVAATMPDGSSLRYQYDAAHRLTEIADSLGNVIQYTLDAMGNRIKEDTFDPSDHLQRTQKRIYDALSRRYNDIDSSGQRTVYSYDANNNLKSTTDPLNQSTAQNYDALNRQITSTDPAGGIVRYGYDAKDRLTSAQDPINLTTTYAYDSLGNLIQLTSPDTGITTYVPDAAGNTVATTDARGLTTTYVYDALNRQTLAAFSGGSVALEYDNTATGGAFAKGRLTRVTDPSGSTTFQYDAWGRVLRKVQTVGVGAVKIFTVSYQYVAGRLSAITYPSGRSVNYAFDAQGHVTAISIGGQTILSEATYAPFGPVQGWTWANGQVYQRAYDLDGRVATVTTGPDSTTFGGGNWVFGYDKLNRLSAAALPPGEAFAYAYDGNGNRKQETRAGATTNYTYFAGSNRLQASTGALARAFTYDAAGNISTAGGLSFIFDGRGRLSQVSNGYSYAINGMGQRVSKSGPAGTTNFAYDEQGHLIGEYDATGAVRQEIVYLADTPVASVRTSAAGGVDIYPIYSDHLNTPRLVIDATNRTVWEWPLDTFGAGAANENPSGLGTFAFNLRFPGQYYDAETGLHYNYFRDYDPKVGRYVESDPIGLKGGPGTYAYVKGNPINDSDVWGLLGSRGSVLPGCGTGWNRSIVPEPFGFHECCAVHDGCYDDCDRKPTREKCDSDFCGCVLSKCETYGRGQRLHCERSARLYCNLVRGLGADAYADAQRKCCSQ